MDAILTRRSIRRYTKEPVPTNVIKELLEAAMCAPSADNEQPWQFIVINDRRILDEIPSVHPYSSMLRQASVAILICGDKKLEKQKDFWIQDCSAATENILIEVQEKGLGAVWLGIYPIEERIKAMQKLLGLPDEVIPFSLIPIGYPDEEKSLENRYNVSRVHYNKW